MYAIYDFSDMKSDEMIERMHKKWYSKIGLLSIYYGMKTPSGSIKTGVLKNRD